MKKIFTYILLVILTLLPMGAEAQTIKATLWNGESASDVHYWANIGDNATESVAKVATPANTVNGVYNPSANSLKMVRDISAEGNGWHGIGLDVAALNLKLSDASQFSMLMMKDKSENAKVEFVCEGDKHVLTKLAWHNGENKWHRLTYTLSESENYADNKDLKIEKIYIQPHTWHSEGITNIYIDDITFGDELDKLPYSVEIFSGNIDLNGYSAFETLCIHNNGEALNIAGKHINKLIYTRDITANSWNLLGVPAFLGTPTKAPTSTVALVSYNGSNWASGTTDSACVAQFAGNKMTYTFENVTGAFNETVPIQDGYQIVSSPTLQGYNAAALRKNDQTLYTISGNKLVKNTATDVWLHALDAIVVYKGSNAPDEIELSKTQKLFLKPNSNWTQDGARFAAYFFGNGGETWVTMAALKGTDLYVVDVPKGYPNVIFCRMNLNTTDNNWNEGTKWNQTNDLTIPTNGTNLYSVADGTWDKGGGTWSQYYYSFTLKFWTDKWENVDGTHIHVWGDNVGNNNTRVAWPGPVMTDEGNGWWSYTFADISCAASFVISGDSISTNTDWNILKTVDLSINQYHDDSEYTLGTQVTEDNKHNQKWYITPYTDISSLTLNESIKLIPRGTYKLNATILPDNATCKTVKWVSSNDAVATVDDAGNVTARSAGNATITAISTDGRKSAICTVEVASINNVPIYFEVSGTGWGENIEAHAWCDYYDNYITATKLSIPHATKTWYKAEIPVVAGGVFVQAHKAGGGNVTDYSATIGEYTQEGAYVINAAQDNNYNHTVTVSDELTLTRSFVYSQKGENPYYSNRITADGTVSYYVATDHGDYGFYQGNDILGYKKRQDLTATESNVYVATITGQTISAPAIYTGDYYIRTDATTAHWWNAFNDLSDTDKADALFTYYADGELDSHYWVKYLEKSYNVNAAVANPYNLHLAILKNDDLTDENGSLPIAANVRFGYNPKTNVLRRTMIDGSTAGTGFLKIYTEQSTEQLFTTAEGITPLTLDKALPFIDASGWVYDVTVYAADSATALVTSTYNGHTQFLFGFDESNNPIERVLRDNDGETGLYCMRVIYDFKTNKIIGGWEISDMTIATDKEVHSNVIISREMNGKATQVTFAEGAELKIVGKKIYTILQITKADYAKNGGFLWLSLPYDCLVKDVYGIAGYGTKWTIQRYRGDKRAAETWNAYSSSFWRDMNNKSATATMEAGRGYVVHLNLTDADFSNVQVGVDGDGNPINKSILRLYFPSKEDNHTFSNTAQSEVYKHTCTVAGRENDDSNWNVIGVTGLHDMIRENGTNAIQGYYSWAWDDTNKRGVYSPEQVAIDGTTVFESTKAYMVQYAGTIDWTQAPATGASLAPRRAQEAHVAYNLQVDFTDGKCPVRTFINMNEQGTAAYDLNRDMGMIINAGMPQIYTLVEASQLAINNLPIENQYVQLGIQAPAAGNYTFSMPDIPNGIIPVLYDAETGNTVNLAFDAYTVALEAGTNETRFSLRLQVPGIATDCEQPIANGSWQITQIGSELLISGVEGKVDIRLYDALGRQLYHTTNAYEMISVPQTGVYVVQVNGQTQRILVK